MVHIKQISNFMLASLLPLRLDFCFIRSKLSDWVTAIV